MDVNKIVDMILSGYINKFYKSKEWLGQRAEALKRDNNECQHCKKLGRMRPANCVHHIKHIKDRPDLALELSNLLSLCNTCHNIEHPEKFMKRNKKRVIEIEERW